jgi:hypothetical protein
MSNNAQPASVLVPSIDDPKLQFFVKVLKGRWDVRRSADVPKASYPDSDAILVSIEAPASAKHDQCWFNVRDVVATHGGRPIFGWSLWDRVNDDIFQAIHHALWERPDGTLIDVTPQALPISGVAFFADSRIPFDYVMNRAPASFAMDKNCTPGDARSVRYTWLGHNDEPLERYTIFVMGQEPDGN